MPVIRHGLAYNDVLVVPLYSRVRSRNEVDLSTVIAPGISLAVPLLSANMDTVTGAKMAIAMDRLGAIGVIGRFDGSTSREVKLRQLAEYEAHKHERYSLHIEGGKR